MDSLAASTPSVIDSVELTAPSPSPAQAALHPFVDLPTLDELERRYLVYALRRFAGNRTRTAAALGIDRRTLYRMSARLGVPITGAAVHGASAPD